MIRIRVPATTANLGPGFDVLGMGLGLYNTFFFERDDSQMPDENNMVYRAYKYTFQSMGKEPFPVRIRIEDEIPISRGLGSSAACIVAGIMGANAMLEHPLDRNDVLKLATQMEGHPDNVAPAIFGGLMISVMDEDGIVTNRLELDEELKFIALVPDIKLSTAEARRVLPKEIPFKDAVYNIGRASLLISALATGKEELIGDGLKDCLHQPYRGRLIPDYEKITEISMANGALGCYISGAGSTIMCIAKNGADAFIAKMGKTLASFPNNWRVMPLKADNLGAVELP